MDRPTVVELRVVEDADLPVFFDHQCDPGAVAMVGLPSRDREAFERHWAKIRQDDSTIIRTVVADGRVAGNVLSFPRDGVRYVGYWLGREHWGRGIATVALTKLLERIDERPLHAIVSATNTPSQRVLEKCGFDEVRHAEIEAGTKLYHLL